MQLQQYFLNDYAKVFVAHTEHATYRDLATYIDHNLDQLMQQLHQYGILIFRGFDIQYTDEFHQLIEQQFKLQPWNSFNPNMPGWLASWMRKYSESILGAGDYRRYIDRNTVQLGPVENSIQGPHVEGGVRSERSRYIALFCQQPSTYLAETGFNNLEKIWDNFPAQLKQKYQGTWNHFSYISSRKINFIDQLLLKKSPFKVSLRPDQTAKLTLQPSPLVIKHPVTQKLAIQPWAFANNTNPFTHQAAQNCFENRGEIQLDFTAEGMQLSWEIFNQQGDPVEWNDQDKQTFFDALYRDALLLQWQKGDIALVDNIKIAHWRMNGEQGNRKLIQIQANVFNADDHYAA
ncbi:TauD/TfdA dioxygenase family protein [Acinetobacter bouvetii]|uniref:Taurine catabolism dioxygenase TauD, TfdA family n=1 Tax=Acinetobacter bouvetii TaxID=202951 RepID=A0A811G8Y3_9GAMM|nr:TauD/TfdA family dioxygenase [Acinetobacter bouvetii]CAB1206572.1 Taurine catabolism dioxygenase TauD, TfdA family [Acinetobacter bouvetii]